MRLPFPLFLAVLLVLAGCASTPEPEPAPSPEDVYLSFLEGEGIVPTYGDAESALTLGGQICDRYDRGDSFAEVTSTLVAEGFPDYEAGQVSGAATAAFCPEHATP